MIQIKNLQKIKRINQVKFARIIKKVLGRLDLENKHISIVLCGNTFIKKLNQQYFDRDFSTDVISFNLEDKFSRGLLGEVVVSVPMAISNSKVYRTTWKKEIVLYIIHGILHILGYRDYTKEETKVMAERQIEILDFVWETAESCK